MVEDDAGIRNFTVNALAYCVNREVLGFRDGLAAWSYIENGGRPDIVISDVDMPEMNGFDLLVKIKAELRDVVFIMMSGKAANEETADRLGADAFLAKPYTITDLFSIVQTYVVG